MQAVHTVFAAVFKACLISAVQSQAAPERMIFLCRAESRIKIIFRSRPVKRGRPFFAVNKEHIIAFPIPFIGLGSKHIDIQIAPDKKASEK